MRTTAELAERLFLSDLTSTPVYSEIQRELQAKHRPDADGEYGDEFWEALSAILREVLLKAADMAEPGNVR
ncbi:MAG: hypothetical protein AB7S93_09690 [Xanthobacteraceae bacterium]